MSVTTIVIIPARYHSTRFPGKPLVDINGKSMINRVYDQAIKSKSASQVWVATDNEQIFNHVEGFGGKAIYTSPEHGSGTSRVAEAASLLLDDKHEDAVIVNLQGDEPFINPQQIDDLIKLFEDSTVEIATLVKKIDTIDELKSVGEAKVVIDHENNAMCFSRSIIPYDNSNNMDVVSDTYYKHVGIYAYRFSILKEIVNLSLCDVEKLESLEQLRWLYYGYKIKVAKTEYESYCVDTPEDLKKLINKKLPNY